MATAADYRKWAQECFEWARAASDESVREQYASLGRVWLDCAARAELRSGQTTAPEPKPGQKVALLCFTPVSGNGSSGSRCPLCAVTRQSASQRNRPLLRACGKWRPNRHSADKLDKVAALHARPRSFSSRGRLMSRFGSEPEIADSIYDVCFTAESGRAFASPRPNDAGGN